MSSMGFSNVIVELDVFVLVSFLTTSSRSIFFEVSLWMIVGLCCGSSLREIGDFLFLFF